MERIAFQSALQELTELDQWLTSLQIPLRDDRWHNAAMVVRKALERRERIDNGRQPLAIPNYVPGLFEALEVLLVKREFSGDTSPLLREKLLRAVSGPISPKTENTKNNGARNTMFELTLAADFKSMGGDVELSESDFLLRFTEATFANECKRPFSASSVRANIHDAASQLGTLLDTPSHSDSFGVIATSLNRVFNPEAHPMLAPEAEGVQKLNQALIELIELHKYEWKWDTSRLHPRIAAVMFHLSVPWDINGERLIYLSTRRFFGQAKCTNGFAILQRRVAELYPVD